MCCNKGTTVLAVALLVLLTCPAMSQPGFYNYKEKKAAALAELKKFPNPDTARVNALIAVISTATFLKERQETMPYRLEALALSRKLNFNRGLAISYISLGHYYKSASNASESIKYYDSSLGVIEGTKDPRLVYLKAIIYERKGAIFDELENFYASLDYYFEALKFTDPSDIDRISRIYIRITEMYTALNNLEKATEYAKKNIALVETDPNVMTRSEVLFPYIDICIAKRDFKTAQQCIDKMSKYFPHPEEVQLNYGYYQKRGNISFEQQHYYDAFTHYQESYKYAVMGGHKASLTMALRLLSAAALKLGSNETAKRYAEQNLELAEKTNIKSAKMDALINLSTYHSKMGDTKKALELLEKAMLIKDSLLSEDNIKQINILTTIYETDKQQKEIIRLQNAQEKQAAEVKQKTTLNLVFIASIIVILFFAYLGYLNFKKNQQIAKQQQILQQQKISELEKDKQLLTIDAMLKGQEEERSRIAKDLHDGLGSSLSGAKLSFMNVRENLVLAPESIALFDKSLSMLDNTIGDLRKVAQNLMPEALVKFGLNEALRDFCDSIQYSTGIKVVYQQFGETRKLNNTAEVFIYRIIQELVANAVKHAEASEILVQLTMSDYKTGITVEDNGKGFDKSILRHTKGAGMSNLEYRVNYFNGTSDIVTSPGNGTSVNIELMV